jgi:hypothetical protein
MTALEIAEASLDAHERGELLELLSE